MKYAHCVLPVVGVCLSLAGCGSSEMPPQSVSKSAPPVFQMMMEAPGLSGPTDMVAVSAVSTSNQSRQAVPDVSPEKAARKIIYNTNISLNVESFDGVAAKVVQLTETCGGFVAGANLSGTTGNQRSGSWTIRIPVEQYRAFLDSAGRLGEIISKAESTREVTAEYYDVEARVRNKQTEEQRLISILEERPGKLDDILAIEKEITRVRGEIEQLQGRMRVLQDLTAFSTVTLRISEVQKYVPQESPTFGTLIDRKWQATTDDLASAGQSIVLTAIGIGPWLLILLLPAIPVYFVVRRMIKVRTTQPAT